MRRISCKIACGVWGLVVLLVACSANGQMLTTDGKEPSPAAGQQHASDELLVKFRTGVTPERIAAIHKDFGATVKKVLGGGLLYNIKVREGANLQDLIKAFERLPEVEYAELNYTVKPQ